MTWRYLSLFDQTTKIVHLMLGEIDLIQKTHDVVFVEVVVGLVKQLLVGKQDGVLEGVAERFFAVAIARSLVVA